MRRLSAFFISMILAAAAVGSFGYSFTSVSASAEGRTVYIGGMPAGFTLSAGGAQVIGISEVISDHGVCSPASEALF